MKRATIITTCLVLAAGGAFLAIGAGGGGPVIPDAKDVIITGRLSCTSCTLANPGVPCPPDCCAACVKAGDPPLLTDALGNMYILVSGENQVTLMTPERIEMMGGQVTVSGLLVRRTGIQTIYVNSMESAEPKTLTITGRLSCTFCSVANPGNPCPPGCCINCVGSGDPTTLTDASGNMYVLLSGEKGVALMTPERMAMVGAEVNVTGLLVSRNGISAIYVDKMEQPAAPPAP